MPLAGLFSAFNLGCTEILFALCPSLHKRCIELVLKRGFESVARTPVGEAIAAGFMNSLLVRRRAGLSLRLIGHFCLSHVFEIAVGKFLSIADSLTHSSSESTRS